MSEQIKMRDCPKASEGVHNWLFYAAMKLKEAGCPKEQAAGILRPLMTRPPKPANEVEATVDAAYDHEHAPKTRWSTLNPIKREQIFATRFSLADLAALSPAKGVQSIEVLAALFRPTELVCIGWDKSRFDTRPLSEWTKLDNKQFIVPSPMSKPYGLTLDGRKSKKTNDNTGPRRYQVVEFDGGTLDEHAAIARELSRLAPLVLCVHSGSKSLHSWFNVSKWTDEKQFQFFDYAVSLGADPKMWTRSQFTRMPAGLRREGSNEIRQAIYYFNPATA